MWTWVNFSLSVEILTSCRNKRAFYNSSVVITGLYKHIHLFLRWNVYWAMKWLNSDVFTVECCWAVWCSSAFWLVDSFPPISHTDFIPPSHHTFVWIISNRYCFDWSIRPPSNSRLHLHCINTLKYVLSCVAECTTCWLCLWQRVSRVCPNHGSLCSLSLGPSLAGDQEQYTLHSQRHLSLRSGACLGYISSISVPGQWVPTSRSTQTLQNTHAVAEQ